MTQRNIFNKTFNPNTYEEGVMARYPNKTKLVDTKDPDEHGNTLMIMTEDGVLISKEKYSGVVYVNEFTFEVFSGVRNRKTGIFKIGSGANWDIETPRQIVEKAHFDFKKELESKIDKIEPFCLCSYPRITNYLTRNSSESYYLAYIIRQKFLKSTKSNYDTQTGVTTTNYNCKICDSEYIWKYRDRGIDELRLTEDKLEVKIGEEPENEAPNFINAIHDKVYCNKSYLFREKLFESNLNNVIEYLFKRK